MLKYPCLVLDHDDTVVQSEKTLGFPFFKEILNMFRPDATITYDEYVRGCHEMVFSEMCRKRWQFTDAELQEEYLGWKAYIRTHIPAAFPGIDEVIRRQKENGGLLCVVSLSGEENILRDYRTHFGVEPDAVYGWDLPEHQRKPYPYPLLDIMQRYGLKPEELLVVDDMKLAWKMAHPLQVPIAFAAWGKQDFPDLTLEMKSLCDYSFDSTKELEKFLFD